MPNFQRKKHQIIADALRLMDRDFLLHNECYFGGGTAIVLKYGEYRDSLDVDFICSDGKGYRELRSAAVSHGVRAFFGSPVEEVREFKVDQYGIRSAVSLDGMKIKFEIIREARVKVSGGLDEDLGVPILSPVDMFVEKLLANADRCQDASVAYRDALDLGMLATSFGGIPPEAIAKSCEAYGDDIEKKLRWVLDKLSDASILRPATEDLLMDYNVARQAIKQLSVVANDAFPTAMR